jgi:hypothetical protein
MSETPRHCIRCGTDIYECMGSVLARDFVSGRVPMREHCGLCALWLSDFATEAERDTYLRFLSGLEEGGKP